MLSQLALARDVPISTDMWKANRLDSTQLVVLILSGRLEGQQLQQLRESLAREADGKRLVLDLKEVRLVDQSVITFLADCEARGTWLRNCPGYIRDWIDAGKSGEAAESEAISKRELDIP